MPVAATDPLWTDVLVAWASIATAIILVLAGGIAWWQASEARSLRRAQSRPFVVIDFDPQTIHLFVHLRIANVGTTMARNISFKFSPSLASSFDAKPSNEPRIEDLEILRNGIRSLPPGKEIRFVFDYVPDRRNAKLPDTYSVTLRYEGEEVKRPLRRPRREQFTDETNLDLGIYWNLTHITRYGQHEIHERLKEIKDEIKRWSASLGGGLLVSSPDDVKRRTEEFLERQRGQEHQPEEADDEEGDP